MRVQQRSIFYFVVDDHIGSDAHTKMVFVYTLLIYTIVLSETNYYVPHPVRKKKKRDKTMPNAEYYVKINKSSKSEGE